MEAEFPPKMEPAEVVWLFAPKIEAELFPLKIKVFADVVGIPPNIDVFAGLPKSGAAVLVTGFPKALVVEETAGGVLGNCAFIVRAGLPNTEVAEVVGVVVVVMLPKLSVDAGLVLALIELGVNKAVASPNVGFAIEA